MYDVNVKLDKGFFKELHSFTKDTNKIVKKASFEALKHGKTTVSKEVRARYNIKKKDIDKTITVKKDKIEVKSQRLTVGTSTNFSITPRQYTSQKGVKIARRKKGSVTIRKGAKKKVPGGFIVNPAAIKGGNTMLWIRNKDKIHPIKSISTPQMVENKQIAEKVQSEMKEYYMKRFEHYMERAKR